MKGNSLGKLEAGEMRKGTPPYDARLLLQQPNREECLERTKTQVKQGQVKDWRESKETDREAGRQADRQT